MNSAYRLVSICLLLGALSAVGFISSRNNPEVDPSSRSSVFAGIKHDVSPPLRAMNPLHGMSDGAAEREDGDDDGDARRFAPARRGFGEFFTDPVEQTLAGPPLKAILGVQFEGLPFANGDWVVPDTNGAIGPTQFVEWINTQIAVFDRTTGAILLGPENGNTLWQGFGGVCETNNNGDPLAQFDKQAGRWVLMQHAIAAQGQTSYQCVAVSVTSDATGSFYRYAFPLPVNDFPDYPKISTWPDAYYLTIDEFLQSNLKDEIGPYVCALDRNLMLQGMDATSQCYQLGPQYLSILPADWDGNTPPPTGSPNYLMSLGANSLNLWKFHVDFANPLNSALTGPAAISVASFHKPCNTGGVCIPQPGTTQKLDSLGDRMMYRLAYRNFVDHESLVANHAVNAQGVVGIRWYEIRNPGATPVVYQQKTLVPDSTYRWMGSIAMDKLGDIGLGYSAASHSTYPSIRITGRKVTDPMNRLQSEIVVLSGSGSEEGSYRWGDYSSLLIDPLDDCTFWFTGQYMNTTGDFNWKTRILSFSFPSCTGAHGVNSNLGAAPLARP
jgi:hypothetical protein